MSDGHRHSVWELSRAEAREIVGALDRLTSELVLARDALRETVPYMYNVAADRENSPWRRDTATEILARVHAAIGDTQ